MEVRTSRENRRTLSSQVYLKDSGGSQPLGERNDEWTAEADSVMFQFSADSTITPPAHRS